MASLGARRAGLLLAGTVLGLALAALALWLFLQRAQVEEVRTGIGEQLDLPREAFELEEITDEGPLRISLLDVVLLGAGGDTIVAAPRLGLLFDPESLAGDGPIVFPEVELENPFVRLIQAADGTWNIARVVGMTAAGSEVRLDEGEGRPLLFRDVTISGGRALVAVPAERPDTASFAADLQLPYTSIGGESYQVYALAEVDGVLPVVRAGGGEEWRVEVAALDGRLLEPDLGVIRLAGTAEAVGEDGVSFDLQTLRVGESLLAGEGLVRFTDDGLAYDVDLRADPIYFSDLQPILPTLPAEGQAELALSIETREGGRTALTVTDAQVALGDSRVSGFLTLLAGGGAPPEFGETRLTLDPLELNSLEQLGLVEDLAFAGQISGTLSTSEALAGALQVDLTARVVPEAQPGQEPSVVVAEGAIRPGSGESPLRLQGLRVQLQPLYLETFADLLPEQRERLRGEVRGAVTLTGTPQNLRAEAGELVYQVGNAAPTRLAGLEGSLTLDPLTYEFSANAQPLALSTLTELVPALPFRTATLAGPIRIAGNQETIRFGVDLAGDAGAIRLSGTASPGTPLRFDVTGRVEAFTASELLTGELPVEGPVTGTFAARGAADDFRFNVDLAQTAGRFALEGRVRQPGGPPQFEVAGQVEQFRLGALIGQPGLFASPLTGNVQLEGGGRQPYRFDVDLRGDPGLFDLEGFYVPGDVPSYAASGQVAGLNLRRLNLGPSLPQTDLTATVALEGQGTTLETLSGTLSLDARASSIGGVPLDEARVELAVRGGILMVDTLLVELRDTRLAASGMWGLTVPAPEPLQYSLVAPNLATLARIVLPPQMIQPQVAGSLRAEGWVAGSVRFPLVATALEGRRLRYEGWQAERLALNLEAARTAEVGWRGEAAVTGTDLVLAGGERLASMRLVADGSQAELAVSLEASRDADTEIALTGLMEFEGRIPRAVAFDSLLLNADGATWRLADRTRIQWGGVDGILVQNLLLRRSGDGEGWIQIDGTLPPQGEADLQIRAAGLDLQDVRRLVPRAPEITGVLAMEAILEGPVGDPELSLELRIDSLRYEGAAADSLLVDAAYAEQRLTAGASVWIAGEQVALAEAGIPMLLSIEDLIPDFEVLPNEPLTARLAADSLSLHLLTAAVPQLLDGVGTASAEIAVEGTLDQPLFAGWARVRDGAVTVVPAGVRYEGIAAELTLEQDLIRVDRLVARSDGTISVAGTVNFQEGAGPRVFLNADLNSFLVMDQEEVATINASGRVNLSGQLPGPVLTGRLVFDETTIAIPELDQQQGVEITDVDVGQIGADTLDVVALGPAFLSDLRIDALEVQVGESVWLVSDDARVQITGDLIVYRAGEDLRVYGALLAERGTYELEIGSLTREFEIVRGRVQFFGTSDLNPSLDIVAANRIRTAQRGQDLTVLVNLTGTLLSPQIRLSSDTPTPLSESDLFSYLIFGQPSFELGGAAGIFAQQIFVQEVLGGLFATGLEQPLLAAGICDYVRVLPAASNLRDIFGTDIGSTLSTTLGAAIVECGKELADELFLTAEAGIGVLFGGIPSWSLGLEWQIDQEWMWELSYGPVATTLYRLFNTEVPYQLSTDIRRRWEYGKSRSPSLLEIPPGEVRPPGEVAVPPVRRDGGR